MSQLVVTAHTSADSIPLGRRIAEIMHEKGQAYSITTMAKRLGFNRETFRLMLKGDREIYSYELVRIAQDLKVPVERILQHDVLKESRELKELLQNISDKNRALELANMLYECAIGLTERCIALNYIGNAHYILKDYENSHRTWLKASQEANEIMERYGDSKLLLKITANLTLSYTLRKEYSYMYEIVSNAEPFLGDDPMVSGIICYSLAKIKEQQGDYEGARQNHDQSLTFYHLTKNPLSIARANHNFGAFEFRRKNYRIAIEYFEIAIQYYENTQDLFGTAFCFKDYAKVYLKLEEQTKAIEFLTFALSKISQITDVDAGDLKSQLYVLLSIAKNDPLHAERVLYEERVSLAIRKIAGEFLVYYYDRVGDFVSMVKYHRVVNELLGAHHDLVHEEEL